MELVYLNDEYYALVDDEDFERVNQFNWSLIEWSGCQYAKRKTKGTTISMHQFILDTTEEVDHIDGDGLNNQKVNLRAVTHAKNIQNQRTQTRSVSGYRGVTFFPDSGRWKRKKPWRARIKIDGHDRTIGYYLTPEEAAEAWNAVAVEAWGEYARLNIIHS